jgi:hypothetical protein
MYLWKGCSEEAGGPVFGSMWKKKDYDAVQTKPVQKHNIHPPGPYTIRFVWYPVGVIKLALAPIISR